MSIHEDIFNNGAIELVIRFGDYSKTAFDKAGNAFSFEHIKQIVNHKEFDCSFSKQSDTEHKLIIPILDLAGQLEIISTWHLTSTYEAKVNRKKKTRFVNNIEKPDTQYRIDSTCVVRIITIDERFDDLEALIDLRSLKNRIDKLEISPKTLIENQRDIWTKYIEAQELIIKKLQNPYPCTGYELPIAIKNNDGGTSRYKFKVNLVSEQNDEYKIFEEELQKLEIFDNFQSDGTIKLIYDDIFRGLDSIIQKKFIDVFEREKNIGVIIGIRPFNLIQKLNFIEPDCKIQKNEERRLLYISNYNGKNSVLNQYLDDLGFTATRMSVEFHIENNGEIKDNREINKRFNLTFKPKWRSEDESQIHWYKGDNVSEGLLPEPEENTFRITKDISDISDFTFFRISLNSIYGKQNVTVSNITYVFEAIDSNKAKFYDDKFSNEFWKDIRRDLYLLPFDITIGEVEQSLYFEFIDRDELLDKFNKIKTIRKFDIIFSPLSEGFKFKVKTNLIAKKNTKQLFQEKLEKLRGVEFVFNKAKLNDRRNDFVNIGKLSSQESTVNQLVFNIPFRFSDEKKIAKAFLKVIEDKPEIKSIQANLKGDEAKTKWLHNAMDKLKEKNQQSGKPNSKPVNPKIRDFIFDSSKAEPIYKFEFTQIEETEEYKSFPKHEILKLNESQRKSILRALYANDLCLLQGPPGTGKTTVIAELIWQLVRQNQTSRILLTSETNLAVDNALEKLMNIKNVNSELADFISLIKPIRFGKANKFEEEGRKYSIDRIQDWLNEELVKEVEYEEELLGEETEEEEILAENPNNNIVQNWMIRIAERSQYNNSRYEEVLRDWAFELSLPTKEVKSFFKDKFLKYVNVIGSTCSSTGSPAFARDFQSIFNPQVTSDTFKKISELYFLMEERPNSRKIFSLIDELGIEVENPSKNNFENLKIALNNYMNIQFDTVIMDEASKATPPDLLLPLCFGKKSIVIGDHRQLPPLLNEKNFKETLLDLQDENATRLAEEIDREFVETSQFKRLILNPHVSQTIKSTFDVQYRMHPKINDVIKQFYLDDECGGLICGLDENLVDSPDLNDPQSRYHGFFNEGFINDSIHTIWVNVDEPETQEGSSRINEMEVEAIKRVLTYLKNSQGFDEYMKHWDNIKDEEKRLQEKEIGIISFYGKQASKLREARSIANQLDIPIRLKTVDKFQGMERNIIIVSTVRSNKLNRGNNIIVSNSDIGFAKAPERLNVALSRARRLLIVVGNKDFFFRFKDREGNAIYKNAINEIDRTGRIIDYKSLDKYITK